MNYQALFEPAEEGGFVVTFPDFPWGITQGDSAEEAAEMAADALGMVLADYVENGRPLPEPSQRRGRKYRQIQLPAMQAAKVELYRHFQASGMRKIDLANRLGMHKANLDRLFDLNHHSRLDQIEAAFKALGKSLTIEVRDAA